MKLTSRGKNIRIVVATPHNEESFKKTDFCKFKVKDTNFIFSIEYNNLEGLPTVYNKYITKTYKDEYVIFVHDDLLISDLFAKEKILQGFEHYDIVGLAGTNKIVDTSFPAWHVMAGWNIPEHGRTHSLGEVAHVYEDNSKTDQIQTSCYGKTQGRALLLDGLFLGINVERLLQTDCKFDTDFNYHFYDLSFCLRANQNKLKMGVIQLFCTHRGLGDGIHSKEWIDNAPKFIKKYFNK